MLAAVTGFAACGPVAVTARCAVAEIAVARGASLATRIGRAGVAGRAFTTLAAVTPGAVRRLALAASVALAAAGAMTAAATIVVTAIIARG